MNRNAAALFLCAALAACSGWEVDPGGSGQSVGQAVGQETLASSFELYETLHFKIRAGDPALRQRAAAASEEIYKKIMFDTNLLSFKPKENYLIAIYKDQEEYHAKTGYPMWSGGGTVTKPLGTLLPNEKDTRPPTAIYTWEAMAAPSLLAHEISHLVFNEFMEARSYDEMDALRWLNEGLATYEETEWYAQGDREDFLRVTKDLLQRNAAPLADAVRFRPAQEPVKWMGSYFFRGQSLIYTNIDVWYWQMRSVVAFLIDRQGRYNFYQFLNALKRSRNVETALDDAYPGKWRTLQDLEKEWKLSQ